MDLRKRALVLPEQMDDPNCDPELLKRTYAQFSMVNAIVAGWKWVYWRHLRPYLVKGQSATLLDIGCGGGDVPRQVAKWAHRDGLDLQITALDTNEQAIAFAQAQDNPTSLQFRQAYSSDLVREGQKFDLITSNHLLHHLKADELDVLLQDCEALARVKVVHSDIERHPLAYATFGPITKLLFRGSFIHEDGLRSIRRSFTHVELGQIVPSAWKVQRQFPFRNLLTYDPQEQLA